MKEAELGKICDEQRRFWERVSKENNWGMERIYVHIWLKSDGTVADSLSHKGMTGDIVEQLEEDV